MTGKYIQRGESIDFVNNTGATILPGEVVAYGSRFYVAGCQMKDGELGTLHTFGVFKFPCAEAGTFAPGDAVSYTAGDDGVKLIPMPEEGEAIVSEGAETIASDIATTLFGICVEAAEKTVAVGEYISVMLA